VPGRRSQPGPLPPDPDDPEPELSSPASIPLEPGPELSSPASIPPAHSGSSACSASSQWPDTSSDSVLVDPVVVDPVVVEVVEVVEPVVVGDVACSVTVVVTGSSSPHAIRPAAPTPRTAAASTAAIGAVEVPTMRIWTLNTHHA
jgi:hypothetical protein